LHGDGKKEKNNASLFKMKEAGVGEEKYNLASQ